MRTIIIGDVHGCLDELVRLVRTCGGVRDSRLVLVGDLVAKGPDSLGALQWAREAAAAVVLGNHDDHLLQLNPNGDGDRGKKKPRPHLERLAATLTPADWDWLAGLPLTLSFAPGEAAANEPVVIVHGGLVPGVPIAKQERKHLLTLRSITADGEPSNRIEGTPWGEAWPGPAHVVHGHDAVRGLQQHRHATGLDTGCVYGRALTALILPERRLVSVPARREYTPITGKDA
jgi:Calcineurin-like phosphoesterase